MMKTLRKFALAITLVGTLLNTTASAASLDGDCPSCHKLNSQSSVLTWTSSASQAPLEKLLMKIGGESSLNFTQPRTDLSASDFAQANAYSRTGVSNPFNLGELYPLINVPPFKMTFPSFDASKGVFYMPS